MDKHFAGLLWRDHFRQSLAEPLQAPVRDRWSDNALAGSLRQFQLGECSEGRHLLEYARCFGARTGDAWLGEAMALFIQEENRHAHWLGEFLKAQGEPLLRKHWMDGLFRWIRKPMGFGLMVSVLVCAEIVAVPYYNAIRRGTDSLWLQAICERLLRDEACHLRFQAANLARVWRGCRLPGILRLLQALFMGATCAAVWWEHSKALSRGGYSFVHFVSICLGLLDDVQCEAAGFLARDAAATNSSPAASVAHVPGSGTSANPL